MSWRKAVHNACVTEVIGVRFETKMGRGESDKSVGEKNLFVFVKQI